MAGLCLPEQRTLSDMLFYLAAGMATGLFMFGPIAAAVAFRRRWGDRLCPYVFRVQWITSIIMSLSLGYLLACARHDVVDRWAALAGLLVFLGAIVKAALGIAFSEDKQGRV